MKFLFKNKRGDQAKKDLEALKAERRKEFDKVVTYKWNGK